MENAPSFFAPSGENDSQNRQERPPDASKPKPNVQKVAKAFQERNEEKGR
jgi:hypothetical protein